jgi:hypothetical protein
VKKLDDQALLEELARKSSHYYVRKAAAEKLGVNTSPSTRRPKK